MKEQDAPTSSNSVNLIGPNGVIRITYENVDTAQYLARPGTEYEVADGCIRTLKRPFYDVDIAMSEVMQNEDITQTNPEGKGYSPKLRIEALAIITDGDPLPEGGKGVDLEIVGRVIVDFFTFRVYRGSKQPG